MIYSLGYYFLKTFNNKKRRNEKMNYNKIKAILSSIENNCFKSRFMNSGFGDEDITKYCDELITVTNDDMNEARKDRFKNYEKFFRNYNTNIPTFEIKI